MNNFKFLRGYQGSLMNILDMSSFATGSITIDRFLIQQDEYNRRRDHAVEQATQVQNGINNAINSNRRIYSYERLRDVLRRLWS